MTSPLVGRVVAVAAGGPAAVVGPAAVGPTAVVGPAAVGPAAAVSPVAAGAVFASERQAEIARIVVEQGRARVSELATTFGVSTVTIRKDLATLETDGRVVRAHGGAIAPPTDRRELSSAVRERLQRAEKTRIAAFAAGLIGDGESIILDASTTALFIARQLVLRGPWHGLTVITNAIPIATELAGHPGITVLMLGGRVRWEALSVVGPMGDGVLRRVNVQRAFVGAAGFTLEEGLTDAHEEEAQIKRAMVAAAREVYAIVDHTKWGRVASATSCRVERLRGVITDEAAPADVTARLRQMGIVVHVAAEAEPAPSGEVVRE